MVSRRTFLTGGVLALISYLFYQVRTVAVTRYTVPVRGLPQEFEEFTILHLSDLHQKRFGQNQERLLSVINRERYDVVAVTGDLLTQFRPDPEPALDLVRGVVRKPVYYVNGNNEWGAFYRHRYSIVKELAAAGGALLDNRAVPLLKGDRRLWIAGVDDSSSQKDRLAEAVADAVDGAPVILLAHSPAIFQRAVKAGVDLVLTGHTHGGQLRIPLVGAFWVPGMGLFPRFSYGAYRDSATAMIVNGGLGESILPVRVNMPPEIVLVTLTSAKDTE